MVLDVLPIDGVAETLQWVLRGALAVAFAAMGVLHFVPGAARTMAAIIPPSLQRPGMPSARALVAFTGLCEVAGGIGLLVPATQFAASMALVVFLVAVFPANAYAAEHRERFGAVAIAFWPRWWAQLALIAACVAAGL